MADGASKCQCRSLARGTVSAQEMAEARAVAAGLARLPIHVDDSTVVSMEHVRSSARLLQSRNECGMIIIDYLQLCDMSSGQSNRNREQEVAQAARKAKLLAKELNVPVVLLEPVEPFVGRADRQAAGTEPAPRKRGHRAGCGYGDVALSPGVGPVTTDRESGYPTKDLGVAIIAKQRNGETGNVYFSHNPEMTKITDYVPPLEYLQKHAR